MESSESRMQELLPKLPNGRTRATASELGCVLRKYGMSRARPQPRSAADPCPPGQAGDEVRAEGGLCCTEDVGREGRQLRALGLLGGWPFCCRRHRVHWPSSRQQLWFKLVERVPGEWETAPSTQRGVVQPVVSPIRAASSDECVQLGLNLLQLGVEVEQLPMRELQEQVVVGCPRGDH